MLEKSTILSHSLQNKIKWLYEMIIITWVTYDHVLPCLYLVTSFYIQIQLPSRFSIHHSERPARKHNLDNQLQNIKM